MEITICYASCTCSKSMFEHLWNDKLNMAPTQSIQKYHRLFAEGFADNGLSVHMISMLTIPEEYDAEFEFGQEEVVNGVHYCYLPFARTKWKRYLKAVKEAYLMTRRFIFEKASQCYVLGDILNVSVSLGCLLAAYKYNVPFLAIVTDLPDMFEGHEKKMDYYIEQWILNHATGYIFLTEAMNFRVNKKNKPYIVLEGHVDSHQEKEAAIEKNSKFIVMYAGALAKIYGIDYLVEGFAKANLENAELHLYGKGDYDSELQEIAKHNPSIKLFGEKLNEEIVDAQKRATILVNPRPSDAEYTKYSFPSKNMEYMASGTPVLTTRLPGMPEEYYPFVYLLDQEDAQGIKDKLEEIYALGREELQRKGNEAKEFVLKYKNSKVQAGKVIKELILGENI